MTPSRGPFTALRSISSKVRSESISAHGALFCAFYLCLAATLVFQGCARKSLTPRQRTAITTEIVSAAQRAADRKSEISIRPETEDSEGLVARPRIVDYISVTLADRLRLPALQSALSRIARHHGLSFSAHASEGDWLFEFAFDGDSTHEVHVTLPATGHAHAAPMPARLPEASAGAVPQSPSDARLAVILDDMGNDDVAAKTLLALPFPLTLSVLPDLRFSREVAEDAYRRGDQVMLHLPMQSEAGSEGAQAQELRIGMSAEQVKATLSSMLQTVPHAMGVNNHEGSLATADHHLMDELMPLLHERNLFFIDSRTSAATVAYDAATRAGVPAASRRVFLDDNLSREAILAQLDVARQDALRDGSAIAIGHPHAATIEALSEELPRLRSEGIRLVFASELVH